MKKNKHKVFKRFISYIKLQRKVNTLENNLETKTNEYIKLARLYDECCDDLKKAKKKIRELKKELKNV